MPLSCRSAFALLVLGLLAPGSLPAQEPYLVRDINKGTDTETGLASHEVLATSGDLYYSFDDGIHGPELWRGEGSTASLVHDLCPGPCGSWPRDFASLDGKVYFFADDGLTGLELWRTDGTPGGTVLLRDFCPGPCSARPGSGSSLVAFGDALFFRSFDTDTGSHVDLWTSDGTREGTRLVADICPDCNAGIYDLTVIGDILYFRANDSVHGIELWSSDGSETALVRDDCPGACSSGRAIDQPHQFTPYGNDVFYWALAGDRWRLRAIKNDPFTQGYAIEYASFLAPRLTPAGSSLFLTPDNNQLQRIDIPTFAVMTVRSFPHWVDAAVALGSSVFFKGWDSTGFGLWRSDGTEAGTQLLVAGLQGLAADGKPLVAAGKVFFTAEEGAELWVSRGTASGTHRLDRPTESLPVTDMTPDPRERRLLLVTGYPGVTAAELWATDGTSSRSVRRRNSIPGSADLRTLTAFGNSLFFGARSRPFEPYHPWSSDGTEGGTEILSVMTTNPMAAASFQDRLIFHSGNAIWTTDGTAEGTRVLLNGFTADHLKVAGDRFYFSGQSLRNEPDAFTGFELWSSDGTLAGTRLIKDLVPGDGSSSPRQITPVGSSVFFLATTESGTELWSSDGTPDGTRLHADLCAGPCSSFLQHLTAFAGRLFFTSGSQLLSSRPASPGILSVFRQNSRSKFDLVVLQGRLFFFAEDTTGREHLWSSDGTAPGTVRLREVSGPDQPRTAHEPTVVGGRLYFTSWSANAGQELWVSDGTAGGTSLLVDLRPGPQGSAPRHLTAAGEHLFFSADDGQAGQELWRTDGTVAGTRRAGDILPGPESAAPTDLTPAGKRLFFTADDGENGRELWALEIEEPEEPYTPCAPDAQRLCLHGGRFEVSVSFRDPLAGGAAKPATAVPDSDQSGFFWFFAPGNLELVVKLLDGRAANGQFWVFFGALSNVEYTVTVTDRSTGAVKTYHNPRGTFCGQADTAAFPDPGEVAASSRASFAPAPATATTAAEAGSCTPGPAALCLGGGRFRVEARWKDHRGVEGTATAVPRTGESGTFWFFSPDNTELMVKVLDGTAVNGKHWVFYGALSDVEYWLTVTDTVTGATKTWHNPPGNYCGRGDTSGL